MRFPIHATPSLRAPCSPTPPSTLDVQYYIWRDDVGTCCSRRCGRPPTAASACGSCSTTGTAGARPDLAALDTHPNIEVRLFDPFLHRGNRALLLTDFARVNRRMHNKSFTADNQATIVGGRNVGDEYFGAGAACSPTWTCWPWARWWATCRAIRPLLDQPLRLPGSAISWSAVPDGTTSLEGKVPANRRRSRNRCYVASVRATPLVRGLLDGELALEWASAEVLCDDPAETLDTGERTDLLLLPAPLARSAGPEKSRHRLAILHFGGCGHRRAGGAR